MMAKTNKEVHMAYKSHHTVASLFSKLKGKQDKDRTTDVVYKINCDGKTDETCNLCYIGTTKQLLKQRMANHRSDIRLKDTAKTALAKHSVDNNHQPDFANVEILQTERNVSKRYTLETLHILNNHNNMNRKQDTQNISTVYCALVSSKQNRTPNSFPNNSRL